MVVTAWTSSGFELVVVEILKGLITPWWEPTPGRSFNWLPVEILKGLITPWWKRGSVERRTHDQVEILKGLITPWWAHAVGVCLMTIHVVEILKGLITPWWTKLHTGPMPITAMLKSSRG